MRDRAEKDRQMMDEWLLQSREEREQRSEAMHAAALAMLPPTPPLVRLAPAFDLNGTRPRTWDVNTRPRVERAGLKRTMYYNAKTDGRWGSTAFPRQTEVAFPVYSKSVAYTQSIATMQRVASSKPPATPTFPRAVSFAPSSPSMPRPASAGPAANLAQTRLYQPSSSSPVLLLDQGAQGHRSAQQLVTIETDRSHSALMIASQRPYSAPPRSHRSAPRMAM